MCACVCVHERACECVCVCGSTVRRHMPPKNYQEGFEPRARAPASGRGRPCAFPAFGSRASGSEIQFSIFGTNISCSGFRVPGFGFRVADFGFWGLRLGVWGFGFGVWGLGYRVWCLGFRGPGVWVSGFGVQISGFVFRGSGLCCGVSGFGHCARVDLSRHNAMRGEIPSYKRFASHME